MPVVRILSAVEADLLIVKYLGDTPRAAHSRFVALIMRKLAKNFSAPADLWEVVGLCHDLDFFHVSGDWSQHGLMTVKWLADRIPVEAQDAIAAHDHRTGIEADTLLADMLKTADAIAIIDEKLGRAAFRGAELATPYAALRRQLGHRSYLCDMLERYSGKHALSFKRIAEIVATAPAQ
ncbi:MAG: HD domain-containing protein [Parvibaculaceae bacterium]